MKKKGNQTMPEDEKPTGGQPDAQASEPTPMREMTPAEIAAAQRETTMRNAPRSIRVIRTTVLVSVEARGDGKEGAPMRNAVTVWTEGGRKLADIDGNTYEQVFG